MLVVRNSDKYDTEDELMKPTWPELSESEKFYVKTYVRNLELDTQVTQMRQLMFKVNKIIDKYPHLSLWDFQ